LTVFVIDDNELAREVICSLVESMGWQARSFDSGEAALAALRGETGEPVDVVLVDWHMPGLDGWETARLIRQGAVQPGATVQHSPAILMVSSSSEVLVAHRDATERKLLDAYLVKPLTASMLYDAVAEARSDEVGSENVDTPPPRNDLAGLRLLVVEDNAFNQQIARELLVRSGAEVDIAGGGLDGVACALSASPPYDAILMDLQMPDIDGLEATRRILAEPAMRSVPIIAMTANAMASDKQACAEVGMVDHISKPIELEYLLATVKRHTLGRAAESAEATPVPATSVAVPKDEASDVDVAGAIRRLGGMRSLYLELVASFSEEAPDLMSQCVQFWAQGKVRDATRCVHSIKGIAATVGASALSDLAAALEVRFRAALADGTADATTMPDVEPAILHLREALTQVLVVLADVEHLG
jgi:CheY-like chemotaxis protein